MRKELPSKGDGAWLRASRRRLGITQREVARQLGVSAGYIGAVEASEKPLSARVRQGIEELLGASGVHEPTAAYGNPESAPTADASSPPDPPEVLLRKLAESMGVRLPVRDSGESLADRIIREQGIPVVPIPILGVIHAGEPIPAEERIEGWMAIPAEQAKGGAFFALRVRGDCMHDAKIDEGDLVLVRRQPEVENGEVAVVLWPEAGEAQVRRVYRRNGQVVLQAANPRYAPDVVAGRDLTIIGLVVGVVTRPAAAAE